MGWCNPICHSERRRIPHVRAKARLGWKATRLMMGPLPPLGMQPHPKPTNSFLQLHCGTLPLVPLTVQTCLQHRRCQYHGLKFQERAFAKGTAINLVGGCDLVPMLWVFPSFDGGVCPRHMATKPLYIPGSLFFLSFQHSWAQRIQDDQNTHQHQGCGRPRVRNRILLAVWGRAGNTVRNYVAHSKPTSLTAFDITPSSTFLSVVDSFRVATTFLEV